MARREKGKTLDQRGRKRRCGEGLLESKERMGGGEETGKRKGVAKGGGVNGVLGEGSKPLFRPWGGCARKQIDLNQKNLF